MKTLLLITALFFSSLSYSQNVRIDSSGNYVAIQKLDTLSKGVNTGRTFTDGKGQIWPVYQSKNGKLYVLRVSKVTGKEYKQYLTL